MSDIVAALSKTSIFSGLPPAYLHRIARIGPPKIAFIAPQPACLPH